MKRHLFILLALAAVILSMPIASAEARNGHRHGHGHHHGRGFGKGLGFGIGGVYDYGWDLAELYRELLDNVPYYALHPPVYYSHPVPRTYGYSPFAYPPYVMTPEIMAPVEPLDIINPHVPSTRQTSGDESDLTVQSRSQPQPLVIVNPFVRNAGAVAQK